MSKAKQEVKDIVRYLRAHGIDTYPERAIVHWREHRPEVYEHFAECAGEWLEGEYPRPASPFLRD